MTNKIPVFLASDDNYAPFVATAIASICDNTKSFVDFYVLDGGIDNRNKSLIEQLNNKFNNFSLEFIEINLEEQFKNFETKLHFTKSMFSRFLIADIKPDIDRALYTDPDVIFLGDVKDMYIEDLEDYIIGAVCDEYFENGRDSVNKLFNYSDKHKYFNSGNLLINCKKWRQNKVTEKLFDLEIKYREKITNGDQDILNKYFDNNYKVMPPKYCVLHEYKDYYNLSDEDVVVRHYYGKWKPWHINENTTTTLYSNIKDFWKYAKMTAFYDKLNKGVSSEENQAQILRHLQIISLHNQGLNKKRKSK